MCSCCAAGSLKITVCSVLSHYKLGELHGPPTRLNTISFQCKEPYTCNWLPFACVPHPSPSKILRYLGFRLHFLCGFPHATSRTDCEGGWEIHSESTRKVILLLQKEEHGTYLSRTSKSWAWSKSGPLVHHHREWKFKHGLDGGWPLGRDQIP